jgi:hypothetical protein
MKKYIIILFFITVPVIASLAITKKAINPSELPSSITADILKRYPLFLILEAYKVNNRNVISFEVIITKKNNRITLYYNSDNKFQKQIIHQSLPPVKKK